MGEFCQTFKEKLAPVLLKLFQKTTASDPAIPLSILALFALSLTALNILSLIILITCPIIPTSLSYGSDPFCVFCYCLQACLFFFL